MSMEAFQYPKIAIPYKNPPKEIKDSAFSKPGAVGGKSWKPAHGVRFRPGKVNPKGRARKTRPDPRKVIFY